jgi:tyrosine-protein kinase Etk/Wzc
MTEELEPHAALDADYGGHSPHLADYWQVITRRLWLVLLIFAVTTASAIWAVSRQRTFFRSHLSLQVNDPLSRSRSLTSGARVSGLDIFVDPMKSEIELLRSTPIALEVVANLGLRLKLSDAEMSRSALFTQAWVAGDAPNAPLELRYNESGETAQLFGQAGELVATANVYTLLDAGYVRFVPQSPPEEERAYRLEIVPANWVTGEVTGGLAAIPRLDTDIIDVTYTTADQSLAPQILNHAAEALRKYGADKVKIRAVGDVEFIQQQLDSARSQLQRSFRSIRDFKESQDFTNLSVQEQQLVNDMQATIAAIEQLESRRDALEQLRVDLENSGVLEVDLVTFLAVLPQGVNPQIRSLADRMQSRQQEMQRLLTEERQTREHPAVQAVSAQLEEIEGQLREAVMANLTVISNQLGARQGELETIRAEQRLFPGLENRLEELQMQQGIDAQNVQFLRAQLSQAMITAASASPYVDVVDPAVGATPAVPRGQLNLVLGALLGIILGIGAAFFLEYLDRTVRTSADVETLLGIPVLGIIPRLRKMDEMEVGEREGLPMIVALDPLDPAAEAYRNLRMNLMFMSTEEEPIQTILFSSAGPSEGKSTTAVNFAVMLAQQGQRVLLIDADLRRPALHRAMDVLREPGLTNLLVGDAEPRESIRPNVLPNLDMLPSGPFPPNPSELLNSKSMQRLLEEFEGKYSHVIIDTPPVLAVTDAAVLGAHTDGVVLVLRSGETEQRAAERGVDQLRRVGVRLFGAVLNEVSTSTAEESYYLQYYYSYHPKTHGGWQRLREGVSRARFW